jgi:hypothetical protein
MPKKRHMEAEIISALKQYELGEKRPWLIFGRRMHPPVYDAVMRLAEERKVAPAKLHHIVVPEDSYPFIADEGAVGFVVKSGAIRIARTGLRFDHSQTIRSCSGPVLLCEDELVASIDLADVMNEEHCDDFAYINGEPSVPAKDRANTAICQLCSAVFS